VVVDTTAPVLTSPAASSVVNATPTISGTAPNGTMITVTDGGGSPVPGCLGIVVLGSAWSCTPSSPLPAGTSTLTPIASDGDGGSVPGAAIQVTVDPTLPVNTGPAGTGADTTPAVITSPSGTVLTGKPTIGGTGPNGTTVTVVDASGTPVPGCVGLVISGGAWTCTPAGALPDGTTKLTPVVDDGAGGTAIGSPVTVTVETVPAGIYVPVLNTTVVSAQPLISGPGIADGDTVTVTDGNGVPVPGCTGIVVQGGEWSCTPTKPLPPGANTLRATETDMSGNAGTPSAPVTVNVDTTTTAIGSPVDGTTVVSAAPVFSGSAVQGTTVTVKDGNGTPVPGCENIVAIGGAWSCTPTSKLPAGQNSFTVTVTDSSGNDATSAPVTVTVNVSPPAITSPAGGATLLGTTPPISGTAVADGDSVTVTDAKGTPVAGCVDVPVVSGAWTCTPAGLPAGVNLLTAVETDQSGNIGTPSDAIRIMVDSSSTPTIATPKAGTTVPAAPAVDTQFAQRRTGDDQQIVGLNFNPGEAVHAVVNSTPLDLGTKIADAEGRVVFNFTVPEGFELGTHTAILTGAVSGPASVTFDVIELSPPIRVSTGGSVGYPLWWIAGAGIVLLGGALHLHRSRCSRQDL